MPAKSGHSSNRSIRRLGQIMEEFRKLDQEMQMQKALTFLVVAEQTETIGDGDGTVAVLEIGKRLGVSKSAASRNVGMLGTGKDFKGRDGLGLLEVDESPEDGRKKLVKLTPQGRRVFRTIQSLLED